MWKPDQTYPYVLLVRGSLVLTNLFKFVEVEGVYSFFPKQQQVSECWFTYSEKITT